jgi:hypothetical protein
LCTRWGIMNTSAVGKTRKDTESRKAKGLFITTGFSIWMILPVSGSKRLADHPQGSLDPRAGPHMVMKQILHLATEPVIGNDIGYLYRGTSLRKQDIILPSTFTPLRYRVFLHFSFSKDVSAPNPTAHAESLGHFDAQKPQTSIGPSCFVHGSEIAFGKGKNLGSAGGNASRTETKLEEQTQTLKGRRRKSLGGTEPRDIHIPCVWLGRERFFLTMMNFAVLTGDSTCYSLVFLLTLQLSISLLSVSV